MTARWTLFEKSPQEHGSKYVVSVNGEWLANVPQGSTLTVEQIRGD